MSLICFSPIPPKKAEESRVNGGAKRKAQDAFASFLDSMLEAIAESSDNEKSKNGAKIMLYGHRIIDTAHKLQKFADPDKDCITPEIRTAAVESLEAALNTLNHFISENPVPDNTIFDKSRKGEN